MPLRFILSLLLLMGAAGHSSASDPIAAAAARHEWQPRSAADALRVLSWNVSRDPFFADTEASRQILAATAADVLLLDEMPEQATAEAIRAVLQAAQPGHRWNVVLGGLGGNLERASVSSHYPMQRVERFDRLGYSKSQIRRWSQAAGAKGDELRRKLRLGVASVGAIAEIHGQRVLLVSFDLQCCGDTPGAWEEERRRVEARLLREAIDRSVAEHRLRHVILGGDANNVQGDAVLARLRGDDGKLPLRPVLALRPEDGSDWTWDGRGTPFASKKIDHLLHSDRITALAGWIFDTEFMPAPTRDALHLDAALSQRQSAHRPLVADLQLMP